MSKPVVAITRPKDRAKKACEIVKELGGEPILAPTLDFKPVDTQSTGKLAEKEGLTVALMPEEFTAEGLIEEFKKQGITGKTIGIPRTASARPVLPEELEKLGNTVILAEAYKSLFPMDEKAVKELIEKIENKEIDAITFTSPLTVENFFEIVEDKQKIAKLLSENLLTVCIGPITAKVLDRYDITHIYPDTYTVPDMMELLFKELDR